MIIIKRSDYSLDGRVKNLWFMKLVERLIDLNKEIKTKQEHFKKTILGNVVFVERVRKVI